MLILGRISKLLTFHLATLNTTLFTSILMFAMIFTHSAKSLAAEPIVTSSNTITTIVTQPHMQTHYVHLDARLEAVNQSTISAQTSGIVESITVDINDKVEAGQTLVILNNTQQKAQLSQAMANLTQAQAQNEDAQILLQRNRSLLAKKTLSQGEYDSSVARAKSAQAQVNAYQALLKQAQEQLSYTLIKAPYSGIVSDRMIETGELVSPGQALMTGFAPQPLRAISDIPKHLISYLTAATDASNEQTPTSDILITTPKQTITAAGYTLFPYANSRYSSVRARIDLPITAASNGELIPGSWVAIALPIGEKQGIYLPQSAILQYGEIASVYVQTKDAFKLRYVRLGQQLHNHDLEIIAGLESNEKVALHALDAAALVHAHQREHQQP